ncbi:MAG: hypothetical protein ACREDR_02185, partial [Blastocatellia bacterium]
EIGRITQAAGPERPAVAESLVQYVLSKQSPRQDNVTVLTLTVSAFEDSAEVTGETNPSPNPGISRLLVVLACVVILAVATAGGWWFVRSHSSTEPGARPPMQMSLPKGEQSPAGSSEPASPTTNAEQRTGGGVDRRAEGKRPDENGPDNGPDNLGPDRK